MMPGLFFFWAGWTGWVVVTFFMDKGKPRTNLAFLLLLVLFVSGRFIPIDHIMVNLALLPLLAFSYFRVSQLKRMERFFMILICQMVTFGYFGFTLYAIHEPAIQWIDRKWMAALLVFLIVQLAVKTYSMRCLTAIISSIHGNLLYALVMNSFSLPVKAGSMNFLDMLAACLGVITIWHGYGEFVKTIHQYLKRVQQRGQYTK